MIANPGRKEYTNGTLAAPSQTPHGVNPEFHDAIARPRDEQGVRLPQEAWADTPVIEDVPFEATLTGEAAALLNRMRPLQFARLKRYHDHILLPARRAPGWVRREVQEALERHNASVLEQNRAIDAAQSQIRQDLETTISPLRTQMEEVEDDLHAHRLAAAEPVAAAGGCYDPLGVGDAFALPVSRTAAEAQSPVSGEPPPGDHRPPVTDIQIPSALGWLVTTGTGLMVGLSLGLISGVLEYDTLSRHPLALALFGLIGCGSAVGSRFAVTRAWHLAGWREAERDRLGRWTTLAAAAVSASILLADGFVEKEGLLKLARSNADLGSLSGQVVPAGGDWLYWLAGIIVVLGFVVYYSYAGFTQGRADAPVSQPAGEPSAAGQDSAPADATAGAAPRRADPKVRASLNALSRVSIVATRRDEIRAKIDAASATAEERIQSLEQGRSQVSNQLPPEALLRIQDACDQAHLAQLGWNLLFEEALDSCEVGGQR